MNRRGFLAALGLAATIKPEIPKPKPCPECGGLGRVPRIKHEPMYPGSSRIPMYIETIEAVDCPRGCDVRRA